MRLKHILYLITLLCAFAEIGMALYAMHWGEIIKDIAYADQGQVDSEGALVRSLNVALPAGVICIFMLLYIWKVDSIGKFALFLALVMHLIGLDLNMRAVKQVYGAGTPLANVTWWAPADKKPRRMEEPVGGEHDS